MRPQVGKNGGSTRSHNSPHFERVTLGDNRMDVATPMLAHAWIVC